MVYLSRTLRHPSAQPHFKFYPGCKKHELVHLMFTDDLMLFCAADAKSVHYLMEEFHNFSFTIGLQANDSKSSMVLRGCTQQTEENILQVTGYTTGSLPFRYLGVPITASRLNKLECRALVDKITARIKTWSTRHLSYAGRAALIHLNFYILGKIFYIFPGSDQPTNSTM